MPIKVAKISNADLQRKKIKKYIDQFWRDNHYPPTIRGIMSGANISSTSVVSYFLYKHGGIPGMVITQRIDARGRSLPHIVPDWVNTMFEEQSEKYISQA